MHMFQVVLVGGSSGPQAATEIHVDLRGLALTYPSTCDHHECDAEVKMYILREAQQQ